MGEQNMCADNALKVTYGYAYVPASFAFLFAVFEFGWNHILCLTCPAWWIGRQSYHCHWQWQLYLTVIITFGMVNLTHCASSLVPNILMNLCLFSELDTNSSYLVCSSNAVSLMCTVEPMHTCLLFFVLGESRYPSNTTVGVSYLR
jgi:hypothetical protein